MERGQEDGGRVEHRGDGNITAVKVGKGLLTNGDRGC